MNELTIGNLKEGHIYKAKRPKKVIYPPLKSTKKAKVRGAVWNDRRIIKIQENIIHYDSPSLPDGIKKIKVITFLKWAAEDLTIIDGLKDAWRAVVEEEEDQTMGFQDVVCAVDLEKYFMEKEMGAVEENPRSVGDWLLIIKKELKVSEDIYCSNRDERKTLKRLLRVLALGFACLEQHGVVEEL